MATISLYASITPNRHTFYYYTDVAKYTAFLATYKVADISLDNARLVNNILSIDNAQIGGALQNINLENVTYIREDRGNFIRFYSVRELQYMGGSMYQFVLQPDTWANYIARATFDHIMLKRSTRIPSGMIGVYDEVEHAYRPINDSNTTFDTMNNYTPIATGLDLEDIAIVFSIEYPVSYQPTLTTGTSSATTLRLVAINCEDLMDDPILGYTTLSDCVEFVSEFCARVVNQNLYDAHVRNMFIVPRHWFGLDQSQVTVITGLKLYTTKTPPNAQPGTIGTYYDLFYAIKPSRKRLLWQVNNSPNNVIYFGTKYRGIKITRFVKGQGVNYSTYMYVEIIANRDTLQLYAGQGDSKVDITQQFSCAIVSTDGTLNIMESLRNSIGLVGGITGALVGAFAHSPLAPVNAASSIFNALPPTNAMVTSGGDGYGNIYNADGSAFEYPIGYTRFVSTKDEVSNAIQHGVIINASYSGTITSLFSDTPINDSIVSNTIVLQLDAEVKGVPMDAGDIITQAFARGIYLINLP